MRDKVCSVYIMTNRTHTVLYRGVTSDLVRRVYEHRQKVHPGSFTARYNVMKLVYYDCTSDIYAAIVREKQIKGWLRKKKVALINQMNPAWRDLYEDIQSF